MKFSVFLLSLAAFSTVTLSTLSAADTPAMGSTIIRINDSTGNGHCIGAADKLTATLRRVILQKKSSMLGLISDSDLALTLTTTVSGSDGSENQSASFAKVVDAPVSQYGTGQISIAQEQSLLSQFQLTSKGNVFSTVDLEVGIVRTQGKSVGAQILLGAVGATKSLSLPVDPFTTAFGVATAYVNSVFEPLINNAAAAKEAISQHITMNIDSADCTGDDERTGTKAIIDAADDPGQPGYVDINHTDNYCFQAVLTPAFNLTVTDKPKSGDCSQAKNYVDLQNPYLAFFVNSVATEIPKSSGGSTSSLPAPATGTGAQRSALVSNLRNNGLSAAVADQFSKAIFSSASDGKVAKSFQVKPTTVEGYRDAIKRCQENGNDLKICF